MELIYGTGNQAKIQFMKRSLEGLPIEIIGLKEAAAKYSISLPEVEENGSTTLENASLKAHAYYECFKKPVFSCDSGLYLWNAKTGRMLPEEEQPGICVRGRREKRYTDDELIEHYTGLVKKYGSVMARYQNGICFVWDKEHIFESMEESLGGESFLLTDIPHKKRVEGFPLDSISVQISSGKYYYDLGEDLQDDIAGESGFRQFFQKICENNLFVR